MSAHAECPLCGHCSRNISVPDPRWGLALNQIDLENAVDDPHSSVGDVHNNIHEHGKSTFWCPCGRMVWMEGRGWLVSLDFIASLATTIRECTPDDYRRLMATLGMAMPDEIKRVAKELER